MSNKVVSSEYNNVFWNELESEMDQTIPEIIKSILAKTGFESEFCLINITSDDILNIESCIDKNKTLWIQKSRHDYFAVYGHYSKKSKFKLLPGHTKIIYGISEHYKKKANIKNESDQDNNGRVEPDAGCRNVSIVFGLPVRRVLLGK